MGGLHAKPVLGWELLPDNQQRLQEVTASGLEMVIAHNPP